jgi:hypothetical protein
MCNGLLQVVGQHIVEEVGRWDTLGHIAVYGLLDVVRAEAGARDHGWMRRGGFRDVGSVILRINTWSAFSWMEDRRRRKEAIRIAAASDMGFFEYSTCPRPTDRMKETSNFTAGPL